MDRMVELLAGGPVSDMLEDDADVGLAERLADQCAHTQTAGRSALVDQTHAHNIRSPGQSTQGMCVCVCVCVYVCECVCVQAHTHITHTHTQGAVHRSPGHGQGQGIPKAVCRSDVPQISEVADAQYPSALVKSASVHSSSSRSSRTTTGTGSQAK
jgi:hypothetical protein